MNEWVFDETHVAHCSLYSDELEEQRRQQRFENMNCLATCILKIDGTIRRKNKPNATLGCKGDGDPSRYRLMLSQNNSSKFMS